VAGVSSPSPAAGSGGAVDAPPVLPGYRHVYSGKVRDLYEPLDGSAEVLVVASDRVSAYDWVLPTPIPGKGAVLTALTLWWFERLADLVPTHLVSAQDVPQAVRGRAMRCRRLQMVPVECVARGYLTGSGLVDYRATGSVCGIALPAGLTDGSRLPEALFTPASKAPQGEHDENISFADVVALVGADEADALRATTLAVYTRAEQVARACGLIVADTKLEFGHAEPGGPLVLGDEVLTPDSSRFWPSERWQPGRAQPSFDKQYVRDWLSSPASGWDRHGGQPPPSLPPEVVERTQARYVEAYRRLTGRDLPAL
jgi:phosphoribosylaminoimidazole-succinocarboxamide synthase